MTEKDSETTDVRYYFYNYPERNKYGISERLMYGTDGYDLSMYPKENITLTGTDGVKTIEEIMVHLLFLIIVMVFRLHLSQDCLLVLLLLIVLLILSTNLISLNII